MESLYLLIPIALIFVGIAIAAFFWAVKSGQYEDLDTEAYRVLFDKDQEQTQPDNNTEQTMILPGNRNDRAG